LTSIILISAYLLDLILGDPQWFPHPVRLMGRFIGWLEDLFRRLVTSALGLKISGIFLASIICGSTFFVSFFLIHRAGNFSWYSGLACSIFLGYTALATRDLHVETRKVLGAVEEGNIPRAREELAFLVGRDTAHLDEPEILRALVETIAENTSDGVIAPLLYFGLGGPPLALTYKAINTLDSMIGYKNDRYRNIGWASAKLDDAANFIPARLSGLIIVLSSFLLRKPWRNSLGILWRDRRKHGSPNSAWPEAAMAGALGVQLGGLNYYFGQPSLKPLLGDRQKDIGRRDVQESWKILYLSSLIMLFLSLQLSWVVGKVLCLR